MSLEVDNKILTSLFALNTKNTKNVINKILLIGNTTLKQKFITKSILLTQPQQGVNFIQQNNNLILQQRYFWLNLGFNNIIYQIVPEFNFNQYGVNVLIKKLLQGINVNQSLPLHNGQIISKQLDSFIHCNSTTTVEQVFLFLDQNNINLSLEQFSNYIKLITHIIGNNVIIFYDNNIKDIIGNITTNIPNLKCILL